MDEIIERFFEHIETLLSRLIEAVPFGIAIGILVIVLMLVYEKVLNRRITNKKMYIALCIYMTVILYMTLFSRKIGSNK